MENMEENSERIGNIWKKENLKVKRYGKYGRKVS